MQESLQSEQRLVPSQKKKETRRLVSAGGVVFRTVAKSSYILHDTVVINRRSIFNEIRPIGSHHILGYCFQL
jgi:hypothetical protein